MAIPNLKKNELDRLSAKTLDAQFCREIQVGLNCSPFEAQAVLEVVHEVFFPHLNVRLPQLLPGKVSLVAVCADEPPGKPIAECQSQTVYLTVHRGAEDDRIFQEEGPAAFRRGRIVEICQEALSQGALLTREDLAYRIFFVSPSTITRDLSSLRKANPKLLIPIRSTIKDIGPVLSHREEIIRLALKGKTTIEICQIMSHSPSAVANYLSTFSRSAQLFDEKMEVGQIAFLLRKSEGLINRYLAIWKDCKKDKNMAYHLKELSNLGQPSKKKKDAGRRG